MRKADVAELAALNLRDPHYTLARSVEASALAWTALADGEPALIVGVTPLGSLMGDVGAPWMLGTDLVTKHQRAFMRYSPGYIEKMQSAFSHLLNFVHAENKAACRWLKHMGFTLREAQPYGPLGAPFHLFEMKG